MEASFLSAHGSEREANSDEDTLHEQQQASQQHETGTSNDGEDPRQSPSAILDQSSPQAPLEEQLRELVSITHHQSKQIETLLSLQDEQQRLQVPSRESTHNDPGYPPKAAGGDYRRSSTYANVGPNVPQKAAAAPAQALRQQQQRFRLV